MRKNRIMSSNYMIYFREMSSRSTSAKSFVYSPGQDWSQRAQDGGPTESITLEGLGKDD